MHSPVVHSVGIHRLKDILDNYADGSRVLLVTGKSSFAQSGAQVAVSELLKRFHVYRYCEFSPNPKFEEVMQAVTNFQSFFPDVVVAIGGGSVLDMAKLITVLPSDEDQARDIILKRTEVPRRKAGFIAIPTTSGSGSEHTQFAVVYMDNEKHSLESPAILPDHIILDPSLTVTMSKYLTASAGADALAQAIESFWAVNGNDTSRQYAAKALTVILDAFPEVVNNPGLKYRRMMMEGAHLAGKAINISKTTAPHALSYVLTSKYGIPHGHAVALTLPGIFEYNLSQKDEQSLRVKPEAHKYMAQELCRMLNCKNPEEGKWALKKILINSSLEMKLTKLGAKNSNEVSQLADSVNEDRLANNPVAMSESIIRALYEDIW